MSIQLEIMHGSHPYKGTDQHTGMVRNYIYASVRDVCYSKEC